MRKAEDYLLDIEDETPIYDEEYYDFEEELERDKDYDQETSEYYM